MVRSLQNAWFDRSLRPCCMQRSSTLEKKSSPVSACWKMHSIGSSSSLQISMVGRVIRPIQVAGRGSNCDITLD